MRDQVDGSGRAYACETGMEAHADNAGALTIDVQTCCQCAGDFLPRGGDIADGCTPRTCAAHSADGGFPCGPGGALREAKPRNPRHLDDIEGGKKQCISFNLEAIRHF